MLLTSRRLFLGGLLSALAAPAIVHAGNIMPVRSVLILPEPGFDSFDKLMPDGVQYQWVSWPQGSGIEPGRVLGQSVNPVTGAEASWRSVPASRYSRAFAISGDTIRVGDCVLVERPKAASVAARNEEVNAAHQLSAQWADKWKAQGFGVAARRYVPLTRDLNLIVEEIT